MARLAREHEIPLLIDNAYGEPFPGAVFASISPTWDTDRVMTFSLSKLGLPGTRTGIVLASEPIIRRIASMTGIVGLANNNIGQAIVEPLLKNGQLLQLSSEVIRPFYESKSRAARELISGYFGTSFPYLVHRSEGAFFLWLWFPELPISTGELYERLKKREVLVVPGEYFFYGMDEEWSHTNQCIRITFSQSDEVVTRGIQIIAQVLREVHR